MSRFSSPVVAARAPNGYAASAPVTPAFHNTSATVAPVWAVRTQRALTPLVRFPPLHATLLARPPFSYVFDILKEIHKRTTLFDDEDVNESSSDHIPASWWILSSLTSSADPAVTRVAFADRVLRRTEQLLGHASGVHAVDMVQSRECEATCVWLHDVASLASERVRPLLNDSSVCI